MKSRLEFSYNQKCFKYKSYEAYRQCFKWLCHYKTLWEDRQAAGGNNCTSIRVFFLHCRLYCLCPVIAIHKIRYEQTVDIVLRRCDRGPKRSPMFCTNLFHCSQLGHSEMFRFL